MANEDNSVPTPTNRLRVDGGNLTPTPPGTPASQQSFTQKLIEVTIQIVPNNTGQPSKFAGTDSDTLTLSGFRTKVRIENSGGIAAKASVTIYGMNPSVMNQLSTLGIVFNMTQRNNVVISAGDANGVSPIFSGTIYYAFPIFNDLPNVSLQMECHVGQFQGVAPATASSYPKQTDVSTIMSGLAAQYPCGFENNGIDAQQLPASYLPGTIRDQIRKVAHDAHINAEILPGAGGAQVLAIWPMGGSRTSLKGQNVPLISKTTGMILSPAFAPNGYAFVRTLFNPQVSFGGVVQIQSDVIPQVNRSWVVYAMSLALDSYVPKGKWEMLLKVYPLGFAAPPPPGGSNG